uniref:Uncharacterized protein n=1 Tax=Romanomermis culicivorax TaxID=13658 RepID=A0A915HL49_ROMCU
MLQNNLLGTVALAQNFSFKTIQEALDDDQWNSLRTHCHRLDPDALNKDFRPVTISKTGLRHYLSVKGKLTKTDTPNNYAGVNINDTSGRNIFHLSMRPSTRAVLVNNKFAGVFTRQTAIGSGVQITIGREILIDILYREGGGRRPRFLVKIFEFTGQFNVVRIFPGGDWG